MYKHEGITAFGCGCNKTKIANVVPTARRVTVYQVMVGTAIQGEFEALQDARAKAVELGGRVKVTSKQI